MPSESELVQKARQCRRLARTIGDDRSRKALVDMASELEAQARLAEAPPLPS